MLISDTHNQTDKCDPPPPGDILIHAGDFTSRGLPKELEHFNNYLGSIKDNYKHVIVIPGISLSISI